MLQFGSFCLNDIQFVALFNLLDFIYSSNMSGLRDEDKTVEH